MQLHLRALILQDVLGLMPMTFCRGMQLHQYSSPLAGLAGMTGKCRHSHDQRSTTCLLIVDLFLTETHAASAATHPQSECSERMPPCCKQVCSGGSCVSSQSQGWPPMWLAEGLATHYEVRVYYKGASKAHDKMLESQCHITLRASKLPCHPHQDDVGILNTYAPPLTSGAWLHSACLSSCLQGLWSRSFLEHDVRHI